MGKKAGEQAVTLTAKQRRMIRLLERSTWTSATTILRYDDRRTWQTAQGVHQTAASLVRKGYMSKMKRRGDHVHYVVLKAGAEALAAYDKI